MSKKIINFNIYALQTADNLHDVECLLIALLGGQLLALSVNKREHFLAGHVFRQAVGVIRALTIKIFKIDFDVLEKNYQIIHSMHARAQMQYQISRLDARLIAGGAQPETHALVVLVLGCVVGA